jgi:hypothetical protein
MRLPLLYQTRGPDRIAALRLIAEQINPNFVALCLVEAAAAEISEKHGTVSPALSDKQFTSVGHLRVMQFLCAHRSGSATRCGRPRPGTRACA